MANLAALSVAAAAIVDRDNRNMYASTDPGPMSALLNAIFAAIDAGSIGITSTAADIDSLALGGGACTVDETTSPPNTSLNFSWLAGRINNGTSVVSVAGGTIGLAANTTNFIQVNRAGTVSSNTSGFTAGYLPLYVVVTGSSYWSTWTSAKALLTLIGLGAIAGQNLTTAAATKEIGKGLGASLSATTSFLVQSPNTAATLLAARLVNSTAVATNGSSYWTFSLANLGPAGTGSTAMLSGAGNNSTNSGAGGVAIAANVKTALALSGTSGNLNTAAGDALLFTATATGSPTALTLGDLMLDFGFTG
jgi:hypothetical protein